MLAQLLHLLSYDFAQNALAAGLIVAVVSGLVSRFVVMRNMAFAVHALSELGFTGSAGAILVGASPVVGLLAGTTITALFIGALGVRVRERDSVVGITMALTSLDPNALDQSMVKVTQGLGVKFNTTALALTLSIVLMVVHYFVDRAEGQLLVQVGRRIDAELLGRFELHTLTPAGHGSAGHEPAGGGHMADSTTRTIDEVIRRQAELWQASLDAAQERWATVADEAGRHLQKALVTALSKSLQAHAEHLGAAEQATTEHNRRQWEPVQQSLTASAESLQGLQTALMQQAESLNRVVEATGQVTRLEDALYRNLAALGGAQNFEQTVVSLAAAIQLLVGRLGELPADARSVRLDSHRKSSHAA